MFQNKILIPPIPFLPSAGQGQSLFSEKSNQKLSTAPAAFKVSTLASASVPHQPRSNLSVFKVSTLADLH